MRWESAKEKACESLAADGLPRFYRPPDELAALFAAQGVIADKEVIAYCSTGVRSVAERGLAIDLFGRYAGFVLGHRVSLLHLVCGGSRQARNATVRICCAFSTTYAASARSGRRFSNTPSGVTRLSARPGIASIQSGRRPPRG